MDGPAQYRIWMRPTTLGPDGLEGLNVIPLHDGALCYVLEDKSVWSLDKESTTAVEADLIVQPTVGPGRWLKLVTSLAAGGPVQLQSNAGCAFPANGNFNQSSSSNFALTEGSAGHPNWDLTAAGGIITYTGPARGFMIVLAATVQVSDVTAPREVFAIPSVDDDFTGAAALGGGGLSTTCAVVNTNYAVTVTRHVRLLGAGSTLRPKLGVASGASSLSAQLDMSVIPV